ncbi:TRAP transporter large permease [Salipiger mucosus]|uniref:TRAP transporter large permease protein n=1 Tax=Salipiger mucosus DSM 16094 TaxID=1123237 RepID=S9SHC4_9RHOB|nr:TRAP transporter large permease subunit [Salipiger mucosus]EPX85689.1 TRAP dicarboxylate transporter, DctM subunit, unknown substrate 6 [Salipiger mucosus DSM 16094]
MGEYVLPLSMVAVLIAGIFSGYPVALVLAGVGILFTFIGDVPMVFLNTVSSRIFTGTLTNWLMLAVPLFVFMGLMLEKSNIAKNLLLSLERMFAQRPGGLALSVTIVGVVMAASTGIIGASVVMLGLMALPVMIKQNYSMSLAAGTICSAGTLGILIPPSIMLVLVGDILSISIGDLFMGAVIPGVLLGGLYAAYILITTWMDPNKAPPSEKPESASTGELIVTLAKHLVAPVLLILGVLGSIVAGVATPTEAAAIGALGATVLAAVMRELTWKNLVECVQETALTTAMILTVAIGATVFSAIFKRVGGDYMIEDAVLAIASGPYQTLALIMLLIFVLGFFLEWIEISYVVLPLFAPIIANLDFGLGNSGITLTWFAVLVAVNLQTSFLTPPFGYALFYLRGIAPPELGIRDIYKGIIPFVLIQVTGLMLCILFPALVLWLPKAIGN